ncbi:MAG: hypothetical protein WC526_01950 [Patescibacteria group bacterium]
MLEQLFGSKTRVKLLHIFFQFPERSFYVREIARLADTQLNAVRREIANMEELGLICGVSMDEAASTSEIGGTGRSKYYKLDGGCLLHFELKALLLKAQMLQERELVELLKQKAGKLKMMMLTGSFTGATDSETDVLLVGEVKPGAVVKIINEFEKDLGRLIRYTIMSEKEFFDRKEIGDKFLYNIFEGKHMVVLDEITV